MSLHNTLVAVLLLGVQLMFATSTASGQTPVDSTSYLPADSQPALTDSSADAAVFLPDSLRRSPGFDSEPAGDTGTENLPISAGDSTSPDDRASVTDGASADATARTKPEPPMQGAPPTPAGADTPQAVLDTMRSVGTKDSTKVAATAPPPHVDSILSRACRGPDAPLTIARDLLVVVFTKEAEARERAAAARSVKGKLVGQAEPGAYYLRVPPGGGRLGSDTPLIT